MSEYTSMLLSLSRQAYNIKEEELDELKQLAQESIDRIDGIYALNGLTDRQAINQIMVEVNLFKNQL